MTTLQNHELIQTTEGLSMTIAAVLVIGFISFGIKLGSALVTETDEAAVEAQYIHDFPDELEGAFYFVPDFTMVRLYRYIMYNTRALNHWLKPENLFDLDLSQKRFFYEQLDSLQDIFTKLRLHCDMITELNDTTVNGNLEHVSQYIGQLDALIAKTKVLRTILEHAIEFSSAFSI